MWPSLCHSRAFSLFYHHAFTCSCWMLPSLHLLFPRFVLPPLWLFLSAGMSDSTELHLLVPQIGFFIFSFSGHVVGLSWLTRLCNIHSPQALGRPVPGYWRCESVFSLWLWIAGPTLPPRMDIRGFMGVCRTSLHVLCGFGEGIQPHPSGYPVGNCRGIRCIGLIQALYKCC